MLHAALPPQPTKTSACNDCTSLGWPEPYICTVYDRMYGDSSAKKNIYTPYIPINVWFWPTLHVMQCCSRKYSAFSPASASYRQKSKRDWYVVLLCSLENDSLTAESIVYTLRLCTNRQVQTHLTKWLCVAGHTYTAHNRHDLWVGIHTPHITGTTFEWAYIHHT